MAVYLKACAFTKHKASFLVFAGKRAGQIICTGRGGADEDDKDTERGYISRLSDMALNFSYS